MEDGSDVYVLPNLEPREMVVKNRDINSMLGLNLSSSEISSLLTKMLLKSEPVDESSVRINVPPTRSDILHACDVVEDVAISFGYNNLDIVPPKTVCIGGEQPLNCLTDLLRVECASAGYLELLSFVLISHAENFQMLQHEDDGKAVKISNAKTVEFEIGRTTLLPGLLKSLASNRDLSVPIRAFEVSDVLLKDGASEVGAINQRHLGAIQCDKTSGFEDIHGLLDFLMIKLGINKSDYWFDSSCNGNLF